MIDLKSQTLEEMTATLKDMGEPSFRGKQIFTWLHKGVTSFDEMSNLSKPLREKLKEQCYITVPTVARKQVSRLDGTIKYLWELVDGNCIETVVMQYHHGNTVCVSSQVGCRMGCAFCASTIAGKVRDLTPSEILDQVIFAQKDSGLPISNIVLMGIGEPLDNLDNVLRFLELVNHPDGLNIGMRHISLSTCGVIPGIERLAELELQLTLSVSLHAPDSETRSKIMPVNRAYDVEKLFDACHRYFEKTGRRISFEYAMIDGVNDHDWQADLIARKLKGMPGHVNLIPLNDVVESPLKPSRRIAAFQKRLESHGLTATVRRSLGGDIDASCGQLRRKAMEERRKRRDGSMMKIWAITDVGLVRKENQDAYRICPRRRSSAWCATVWAALPGGQIASTLAAETYAAELEKILKPDMTPEQLREASSYAVAMANQAVENRATEDDELSSMGTTLVSAIAYDGRRSCHQCRGQPCLSHHQSGDHPHYQGSFSGGDPWWITAISRRMRPDTIPSRNLITRALGREYRRLLRRATSAPWKRATICCCVRTVW